MSALMTCAGCRRPMRPVEISAPGGATVDGFACPYCSAVVSKSAALERVIGRALSFAPDASAEARRCDSCGVTMATEKLEGAIVDRCPGCTNVFLDAGELEHIAGRQLFVRKPARLQVETEKAAAEDRLAREANRKKEQPITRYGRRRPLLFDLFDD